MRILLVEDELDLLKAVKRFLDDEHYAVDVASDGEEGLTKALMWNYDLVVLDLMLPKIDGLTVLKEIRRRKRTPILILTARDTLQDRVAGLDIGADDYLVKPFELDELSARIRALIRRSVGVASPNVEIGETVIDLSAKQVRKAGVPVALTAMEYSLVEYLALRRGKLVSRSDLYDHLFDEHDDSLSNLLDVHVSNVRRKLGKELITTRRGQGYLIDD
ncbi:MAG: response regulator transcription factor [Planctomycetota bacterium]|nr:response regulator transcription factor [Planctomycetota bacterium]MDA1210943.1 response regulator transcription factor [Planctomycetota bacterium]